MCQQGPTDLALTHDPQVCCSAESYALWQKALEEVVAATAEEDGPGAPPKVCGLVFSLLPAACAS